MKVILNSDVLCHPGRLVRELGRSLPALFDACRDRADEIVVPLTTRLEFDRHQRENAELERSEIAKAYKLLSRVGIKYEERDPVEVAKEPNLLELIAASGVRVTELEPTHEELLEANRRASLHERPHPPDSKSDEMRDLVIWGQHLLVPREKLAELLTDVRSLFLWHPSESMRVQRAAS